MNKNKIIYSVCFSVFVILVLSNCADPLIPSKSDRNFTLIEKEYITSNSTGACQDIFFDSLSFYRKENILSFVFNRSSCPSFEEVSFFQNDTFNINISSRALDSNVNLNSDIPFPIFIIEYCMDTLPMGYYNYAFQIEKEGELNVKLYDNKLDSTLYFTINSEKIKSSSPCSI